MTSSSVEQAQRFAQDGQAERGAALLGDAGDRGDAVALAELAVWRMTGAHIPRDLVKARGLLRRAVVIGHVDAALMEIALTANGSGAAPDWPAALALLRTAARGDHVAANQLKLVKAMKLDDQGAPRTMPSPERLSEHCDLVRYPRLFSPEECMQVATVANDLLEPALVLDPTTGRQISHPIRTSDGAVIGPTREDLVIRALNHRLAAISGTQIDQGEALAVLRYAPGQQYRPHLDSITGAQNQRIKTVLIYLNHGFQGGETIFSELGVTIVPQQGDAIVFTNVTANGSPDPASRHAGLPVIQGVKWLATRWIRAHPLDVWKPPPS
ncbi:MAG: 2OG-Fe(II) oxygenase [Pseudomonadota bacterium]